MKTFLQKTYFFRNHKIYFIKTELLTKGYKFFDNIE